MTKIYAEYLRLAVAYSIVSTLMFVLFLYLWLSSDENEKPKAVYCTREANHDGPCNGYPTKSC